MCTGKCSLFIAVALYPLVLLSVICNIVLFFPGGSIQYAKHGHITEEVKYMGGLLGGGVMVLIPALFIHLTGKNGCCGNRLGMFVSITFAAVGLLGALFSFTTAAMGLHDGPLCLADGEWQVPFKDSKASYLTDFGTWARCSEPKNVVQFNTALFITLGIVSCVEALLCASQVLNGLFGCLCGTCKGEET